ncbi:zinc finger protein with KRAB and SCAN domains 5-like [Cloeon dipterum]|uniref:zinc finger protein with KRAB and SCAN domains 5-like n=1 Tax=Cloeon dipterum TaxID=197152 RepID=UPI00322059E1
MNEGSTMDYTTIGGLPFQGNTLPPMHQFNKYSDSLLGTQGTAVMVATVGPDGGYQYVMGPPEQSPPRITQLTAAPSLQVSPSKYAMMWDSGSAVPVLTSIEPAKLMVPHQATWRIEYDGSYEVSKLGPIKEEEKPLEEKLWHDSQMQPQYTDLGPAHQLTSQHLMMDTVNLNQIEMKTEVTETFDQVNSKKRRPRKAKVKVKKPRYRPGDIRITVAPDGSQLFSCPECSLGYPERQALEVHMSTHKQERRFRCDTCGATLKRKEHLDQHMRGHSTERPFVCDICKKGFKRNEHLTRHQAVHSGDKNFACLLCDRRFARKDHLTKHTQTHTKKAKSEIAVQQQQQQQQEPEELRLQEQSLSPILMMTSNVLVG